MLAEPWRRCLSPQLAKLGCSLTRRLADLQWGGRGGWLTGAAVSAIPRGSPHDLARFWHRDPALRRCRHMVAWQSANMPLAPCLAAQCHWCPLSLPSLRSAVATSDHRMTMAAARLG